MRKALRRKLLPRLPWPPALGNATNSTNDICLKMSLVNNGDVWTLPNGIKIYVPLYPWDSIQKTIVNEHQFFEQDILNALRSYIPDQAVILDIGANIGNHSLFWATLLNAKTIHAFEPLQETYRMLVRNIEINELENVIIPHNIGLGDKSSSGEIAAQDANNIGGTSIKESGASNRYALKIERLDDIDLGETKIDFCKIDVEGYELKTLAGMKETLRKYKPVVFIEAFEEGKGHPIPKGCEANAPKVKDFFRNLGYDAPLFFAPYNWLFVPKSTP